MPNLSNVKSSTSNLLYFEDESVEDYIYKILEKEARTKRADVIEVKTERQARSVFELSNMEPLNADKWLFKIDIGSVSPLQKQLFNLAEFSDTSLFLFETKNGSSFFKARQNTGGRTNAMFCRSLSFDDISFLLKDYDVNQNIKSHVQKHYRDDVAKVFRFLEVIKSGEEIKTTKELIGHLGVSASDVRGIVFDLLKPINKDPKRRIKKVISSLEATADKRGIYKLKNDLKFVVKDILDIKMLYLSGVIYKEIKQNLPDGFDGKKLRRYNWMFKRGEFENFDITTVQRLYLELSSKNPWYTSSDMLGFTYRWFSH